MSVLGSQVFGQALMDSCGGVSSYSLEKAQVVGIFLLVGMVGMVGILGIKK